MKNNYAIAWVLHDMGINPKLISSDDWYISQDERTITFMSFAEYADGSRVRDENGEPLTKEITIEMTRSLRDVLS